MCAILIQHKPIESGSIVSLDEMKNDVMCEVRHRYASYRPYLGSCNYHILLPWRKTLDKVVSAGDLAVKQQVT